MSAALIRRSVAVSFLLALLLGVFAMPALAGGRQVLADYEDNGQIDGCYTLADYEEALKIIRPDQQQYGAAVDVIRQAELTNIRRPGQACGATSASASSSDVAAPTQAGSDDPGTAQEIEQEEGGLSAVAIAIIVAVGLALIGFIIYLIASRRGGSGGDGSGDGGNDSGSA